MKRIGAIVLAAGASTRLGRPKQLVKLGGETLLDRAIRIAKETPCAPIVVVLGASVHLIRQQARRAGVQVIFNSDWQRGMASSIRAGLSGMQGADGVILMVCDMPAVTTEHMRALCASGEMTASAYAGRQGVPAYLPRTAFSALMSLEGDLGARELLRDAAAIELFGGDLDVDTEEDVRSAQEVYGGSGSQQSSSPRA